MINKRPKGIKVDLIRVQAKPASTGPQTNH